MKALRVAAVMAFSLVLVGCDGGCESAEQKQERETRKQMGEAHKQAGMPNVVNFQERKLMKQIYELRDQENLITWVYTQSLDGKLVFLFKAMGYGLPYGTQYTNPSQAGSTKAQAEPNMLYMPPSAEATWLMAIGPDGKPHPVYVEPRVIVSPFPLLKE